MQRRTYKRLEKCLCKFTRIAGDPILVCSHILHRRGRGLRHTAHQQAKQHPASAGKHRYCRHPAESLDSLAFSTLMQKKKNQSKQRPHKTYGFYQHQHTQIKRKPYIIETRSFISRLTTCSLLTRCHGTFRCFSGFYLCAPLSHCQQKSAVNTCHRQIGTKAVVAVDFRYTGQKPQSRRHHHHDRHVPPLQPFQQRKHERQVHHIISRKSQTFSENMRIQMQKPPFKKLPSRRIIPEFRRHIAILTGKTVQKIKRFHICRPEVDVIPPAHHFARCAYGHENQ